MDSGADGGGLSARLLAGLSEEYLAGYRAGYEDGRAPYLVWMSGAFVVIYVKGEWVKWSWRNIPDADTAAMLLSGLEAVTDKFEDWLDDD